MECESLTVISIDFLLVYENKYYLQVYLDNCDYKIVNKQMTNYLDENAFKCCIAIEIDIGEEMDLARSRNSKECMIFQYMIINLGFKFQGSVYNGCHDLTMLSVNISDIAIITVKNVDYCCIINNIRKSEAINLLKNSVLENRGYI